jgi:hypothetical protein
MSRAEHVCAGGGVLVPGAGRVADDPADFVWTPAAKGLGCGRLRCSACGKEVVASAPAPDGGRAYRCDCAQFVAYAPHWLDGQGEDSPSGRAPASWRCGGHAPRLLPVDLDGVHVGEAPDWRAWLMASVEGRLPERVPVWLPDYPGAWLERLVATLDDAEQQRFGTLASALLDEVDIAPRRAGLDLAERLGLDGVTAGVVARVAEGRFDWGADEHLRRFVIEQLRHAAVGTDRPDVQLRDALRLALKSGHGGALMFAAGRHDFDWLADNAVTLAEGTPRARTRILSALADHPEAAARARRLLDAPATARTGLRARWVLIDAPPGTGQDACTARLGFESTRGELEVLGDVILSPCSDLQDAIDKALAVFAELGMTPGSAFSLIYPHYPVAGALDAEQHRIAWAIKDAADARGWEFRREMPIATRHRPGRG